MSDVGFLHLTHFLKLIELCIHFILSQDLILIEKMIHVSGRHLNAKQNLVQKNRISMIFAENSFVKENQILGNCVFLTFQFVGEN